MGLFEILAILITLAALFSYVNYRYIRLPSTIGLMFIALVLSLVLILVGGQWDALEKAANNILQSIDFEKALLHGMLGFLLFAGALHIDINDLLGQKWIVGSLATIGVLVSTAIVGTLTYLTLDFFGVKENSFALCLVFGALISPTDPIAVLSIMKTTGAPKSLETKVAGESLFNDGIGVVLFAVLMQFAVSTHEATDDKVALPPAEQAATVAATETAPPRAEGATEEPHKLTAGEITRHLAKEALGGAVLGMVLGLLTYALLKQVNNYKVEVLLTLALVTGGYALAMALHTSGPIAMVVAGLFIGNRGRSFAMSEQTREHLDTFWELVDEILNAILFVLLGLEVLVITFTGKYLIVGILAIPIVLLARGASVWGTVSVLRLRREFTPGAVRILTWGGLKGGISVALALSIPPTFGDMREVILVITYTVVVFSIIVQGLTVGPLIKKIVPR